MQQKSVVGNLLKRSFSGGLSMLRGLPAQTLLAYQALHVAAQATSRCFAM